MGFIILPGEGEATSIFSAGSAWMTFLIRRQGGEKFPGSPPGGQG
jgi:hypothetical protein